MRYHVENGDILYQFMYEQNEAGRYMPDWKALLNEASGQAERECVLKECKEQLLKEPAEKGYIFPLIYFVKQRCGHYEMFQSPYDETQSLDTVFSIARKHVEKTECSDCWCSSLKEEKKGGFNYAI